MFDVEGAKQALQQRVADLEAQIAVRTREVEQGMLVERELATLTQQRDEAQKRLDEHNDPSAAPAS